MEFVFPCIPYSRVQHGACYSNVSACYSNVSSAMVSIKQHVNGKEHIKKVKIKTARAERGTRMLQSIAAYKETHTHKHRHRRL
jgi:hypothetical protein